jgi:hypothetical protein
MTEGEFATAAEPTAAGPQASCWTAKRRELLSWLERVAPQLAPLYAGAVVMVADDQFPGRVVFVWHAIREMRNRLPESLAGEAASAYVQYGDLASDIWRCWVDDGWPEDGSLVLPESSEPSTAGPKRYEVSRRVLVAVAKLVSGHVVGGRRNQANAERLFEAVAGTAVPPYVVSTWVRGGRKAHKLAHVHNKPVDRKEEGLLASDFAAFEEALLTIAKRAYENMDDLDEILGSANR